MTTVLPVEQAPASILRLLLVEDAASERSVKRVIPEEGFSVAGEAASGSDAIDLARQLQPDMVIVAVEEPAARGLRTIEMINLALPGTPVVAISSLADRESLRRAMLAGARDYLIRPIDPPDLRQALLRVYDHDRERQRLTGDGSHPTQNGEIIAVLGAKGGIGRTTIASNLAVGLVRHRKHRTALVDLDLQLGDAGMMLDVAPDRTLVDLIPMLDKLDPELMGTFLTDHPSGLKVLPGPARPEQADPVTAGHVRDVLEVLARAYDYVVVDLARQLDEVSISALDSASLVCLVTSGELTCLKNTRLYLDLLASWHYGQDKVKLIVNQCRGGAALPPDDSRAALDYPVFWKVPYDPELVAANQWGQSFVLSQPKAKISRNLLGLAEAITGVRAPSRSFLSRLGRS